MFKTVTFKKVLTALGILVFILAAAPLTAPAKEKAPPYTEWKPKPVPQPLENGAPTSPNSAVKEQEPIVAHEVELPADTIDFQTEEYVVQEGDWIAKILRKKGVLKENNLPKLLEILQKFNKTMKDFNLIQPGERIVILVKAAPETSEKNQPQTEKPFPLQITTRSTKKSPSSSTGLKFEPYRIQRGDILSRVVIKRYPLTTQIFTTEYLDLFKKCNPSIKNPDRIFPGQMVNLPLYPPVWHESPASPPAQPPITRDLADSNRLWLPNPKPVSEIPKPIKQITLPVIATDLEPYSRQKQETTTSVAAGLCDIVPQMGEQWIHSGEHFIPLKSGGHINLKADAYPIVKLHGGTTLIVDLYDSLPARMSRVIESSWGTYRIVHLSPKDDLASAFNKILRAFQYPKIFKKGDPLKLSGAIPVSITGDWIVIPPESPAGGQPGFLVINLLDNPNQATPQTIKTFLKQLDVALIEFPSAEETLKPLPKKAPETALNAVSLIETLLTLTGRPHGKKVKISAFESRNDDFKLTVTADFHFKSQGKEWVIDLSGLDPEIVALLKENGVSVLSLSKERDALNMASRILAFLGWPHKMGPHTLATAPDDKNNIKLTLSGIIFFTEQGHSVFMTPITLPPEVALFLYQKGYRVITLAPFSPETDQQAIWKQPGRGVR